MSDSESNGSKVNLLRTGAIVLAMSFAVSSTTVSAHAVEPAAPYTSEARKAPTQTLTVSDTVSMPVVNRDSFSSTPEAEIAAAAAQELAVAQAAAQAVLDAEAAASRAPANTRPTAVFAPPQSGYSGDAVLAYAKQFIGVVPYGTGANPATNFSCDGLTQWSFAQFGVGLPRTVTAQQALGTRIAQKDAAAGDLVVWPGQHVGIYDGAGGVVHAPDWGRYVEHKNSLWGNPIFIRL